MYRLAIALLPLLLVQHVCGGEIGIDTLLDHAHKNSWRLKIKSTDVAIEQERLDVVKSAYYPTLSLGYNSEYNKKLSGGTGESASIGDTVIYSGNTYEDSMSLRLNYDLYRFGATQKEVAMQQREIRIKTIESCHEENRLSQEILDQYAQALKAHREWESKKSIAQMRSELYAYKERLVEAGKESRSSVANEAIEIINVQRDMERSRLRYDDAIIKLSELSTLDLKPSDITLSPLYHRISNPTEYDQTIEAGIYHEKIAQKDEEISRHFAQQLPSLSAYGNYYLYGSDDNQYSKAFDSMEPNSWNAGLSIRWDLFSGFKSIHEAQALKLEKERLQHEYNLKKSEFESTVHSSTLRQEHLSQMVEQENLMVSKTHENIERFKRLIQAGEGDALTLLTHKIESAERELTLSIEEIQNTYESMMLGFKQQTIHGCKGKY